MGQRLKADGFLVESRIARAAEGDPDALYALGCAFSAGSDGADVNLIEAHKWFNLAALNGSRLAQESRAEISDYMSAREIAEAQRQARSWLAATAMRQAA